MRILHVVESLAPRYGGPSVACPAMCRELARRGHEVAIYSTDVDGGAHLDVPLGRSAQAEGVCFHYFRGWTFPPRYKFSWSMAQALKKSVFAFDLVHIYSLYGFSTAAAAHYCRKYRVPYLLHPHGSLDPFLRRRHAFRKKVYSRAVLFRIFAGAAAVMFNSAEERRLARPAPELVQLDVRGGRGPISVIADIGVEEIFFTESSAVARQRLRAQFPETAGRRLVTYFGRLNFKKGLDILVAAFCELARELPDIHLVLAGPDSDGYGEKIRGWLRDAGMLWRATFTGNVAGADRVALLQESEVMALPSYTENFGQAVAESMAAGVPVIISDCVNIWPEVAEARAGLVVRCDAQETARALRSVLADPPFARELGRRGRALAGARFRWSTVGEQILRSYEEILERHKHRHVAAAARDMARERVSQIDFYREQIDPEEEITRPRCYPRPVQYLLQRKFAWALDQLERRLNGALAGRSALVICCGSGMESEILSRRGLRVTALDISPEAVERARERARRFGVDLELLVGDAENLPFADGAYSIVFVHDGLHHLPEAYRGVREMLRVAREAVVVAEPADAALTRLSVKLGISGQYEDAGNFVYRLRKDRLAALFSDCGLREWRFRRNLIYYQPWTYRIYRWFEKPPLYWLFCAGYHAVNLLFGRWGNSLRAVAWKDQVHAARS